MGVIKDLTGKQFGYLTVLNKTNKRIQRKVVWECLCICGNKCEVLSTNLISGRTVSCGCLRSKIASQTRRKESPKIGEIINGTQIIDIKYQKDSRNFNECWVLGICKICGNHFWVKGSVLRSKATETCGCIKKSYGEALIEKILKDNNIKFEKEKTFKDCYFSDIHNKCRFDFYIDNKYLIEFDGKQHFEANDTSTIFTKEIVELIQKRDLYKNEWCKENNIPLIRIPYYHLNNLILDDLLLETTNFLIS